MTPGMHRLELSLQCKYTNLSWYETLARKAFY